MRVEGFAFHHDAEKSFDSAGDGLKYLLKSRAPSTGAETPRFRPDYVMGQTITEDMIRGEPVLGWIDYRGRTTTREFPHEGRLVGLPEGEYTRLVRLARNMRKATLTCGKSISDLVTQARLEELIFDWLRQLYTGKTTITVTRFVLDHCERIPPAIEIWFPVAFLSVESPLCIGDVQIRNFTGEDFDRCSELVSRGEPTKHKEAIAKIEKQRKNYQGFAHASIRIRADRECIVELAVARVEDVVSYLRLFHWTMLVPDSVSYCALKGKEAVPTLCHFEIEEGRIVGTGEQITDRGARYVILTEDDIHLMYDSGLREVSKLLCADTRTPLEEEILESILLYTSASLQQTVSARLIYTLVALEMMLLKNDTEPLTNAMAERLAFFLKNDKDGRRGVADNVRRAYKLRSGFVHHGKSIDVDEHGDVLRTFARNAWEFFITLLKGHSKHRTKEDLLAYIDDVKWGVV